jgi:carboxypeptidase family protein
MIKQNTIPAAILSAFALTALFLFSPVMHLEAGVPIRGIEVKLGKNPGGNTAARTTTDSSGHFSFPVQPAGSYTITIASTEPAQVTVQGALGGTKTRSATPRAATSAKRTTAPAPLQVTVKSDGKTPLTGICQTAIVKSRSNISNNRSD